MTFKWHVFIDLYDSVGRSGVSWCPAKDQRYVGDYHEKDRHPIKAEQQQRVSETGGVELCSPQVNLHTLMIRAPQQLGSVNAFTLTITAKQHLSSRTLLLQFILTWLESGDVISAGKIRDIWKRWLFELPWKRKVDFSSTVSPRNQSNEIKSKQKNKLKVQTIGVLLGWGMVRMCAYKTGNMTSIIRQFVHKWVY